VPVVARRYGARAVGCSDCTTVLRRRHGCALKRVSRSRYYQRTVSVTRSVACPPQGRAGNAGSDVRAALLVSRSVCPCPSVSRSVGRPVPKVAAVKGCVGGPEHDRLLLASRRGKTMIRVCTDRNWLLQCCYTTAQRARALYDCNANDVLRVTLAAVGRRSRDVSGAGGAAPRLRRFNGSARRLEHATHR
jgi:hypothetical protein